MTAEFEDNWNKILEKHVFGCDNPPRWVILASPRSWLLIDRTKFHRHSLLRFDWKELFSRREDRVLSLAAALLAKSSMENRNGTVLLDRIDEDAHKQAYGVSESLKLSLRRAIELLGNEAATQIIEKARRDKKTVRRDETFANDPDGGMPALHVPHSLPALRRGASRPCLRTNRKRCLPIRLLV
ncbi:MAG: hypothetical protein ACLUNV_08465 [Sutterella wadsworthensis]